MASDRMRRRAAMISFLVTTAGVALLPGPAMGDEGDDVIVDPAYSVVLSGDSDGKADDKLALNAPARDEGATAKLFKVRKGGGHKLIAEATLNGRGNARFTAVDTNGRKMTTYVAKVTRVDGTKYTTNRQRLR